MTGLERFTAAELDAHTVMVRHRRRVARASMVASLSADVTALALVVAAPAWWPVAAFIGIAWWCAASTSADARAIDLAAVAVERDRRTVVAATDSRFLSGQPVPPGPAKNMWNLSWDARLEGAAA